MRKFGVLAGRSSRCRLLLVLVAVLAMVPSLGAVSSAQAAVAKATLSLSPSTAIRGEVVKATGKVAGAVSRPVWVQRKSGTRWVTMVKAKTTRTGTYTARFKAPAVGSYLVRTLAPRVTIARRVRAQYVSSAKTLKVVAQTAGLSIPATLVTAKTARATLTFRPVRAGRVVALQVWRSGVYITVATGRQSATGTASLTVRAGTPGKYAYRAWTAARSGAPAFANPYRTLKVTAVQVDTTAPGPVTALTTQVDDRLTIYLGLFWTNPTDADFTGVMIRRAVGTTAPTTPTSGTLISDSVGSPGRMGMIEDRYLAAGTTYSYALFAHDGVPNYAAAATVTRRIASKEGAISGTVKDAGGAHHGLANVSVQVTGSGILRVATTAADGSYTVTGLPTDREFLWINVYRVCFNASGATDGTSGASGHFVSQCYNNQPISGTPTPVTVTEGGTRTGVNAALAFGGAISGTVTAAGTHHGLGNIRVSAKSPSTGVQGTATTGADGSYTVPGVLAGNDYQVCFAASDATSGSSEADVLGYADQCYDNLPYSGLPTPVAVTLGATTIAVNAALQLGGAVSGRVTNAGGTHQGLANVKVSVISRSTGEGHSATTAVDGSYVVTGLAASSDYQMCLSVDGYLPQCYYNQPAGGTPTPVVVLSGAITSSVDVALVAVAVTGAVSGRVTDAGGTHHGLANVQVSVFSPSTGAYGSAKTTADGTYTVTGLPVRTDYLVCFEDFQSAATGGSSDDSGYPYVTQCYNNQPISGTPTPVTVTLYVPRTGVDAALVGAGM